MCVSGHTNLPWGGGNGSCIGTNWPSNRALSLAYELAIMIAMQWNYLNEDRYG